jgi:hypothetical protein
MKFDLEKLTYEARPYFYGAVATYCLANASQSRLLFFSGILIGFAGIYVFKLRRDYRTKNRKRRSF